MLEWTTLLVSLLVLSAPAAAQANIARTCNPGNNSAGQQLAQGAPTDFAQFTGVPDDARFQFIARQNGGPQTVQRSGARFTRTGGTLFSGVTFSLGLFGRNGSGSTVRVAPRGSRVGQTANFRIDITGSGAPRRTAWTIVCLDDGPTVTPPADQTVDPFTPVSVSVTAQEPNDPDPVATYAWTAPADITLIGADTPNPSFIAPFVAPGNGPRTILMELTVTDDDGDQVTTSTNVTINEADFDLSDAPSTYQDTGHVFNSAIRLGASIDIDTALLASPNAGGDGADDDGITISELAQRQSATVTAQVAGPGGFLQGWIDFDGSGTFEADEQIAIDLQDGGAGDTNADAGTLTFDFPVPQDAITGQSIARFRWSTQNGIDAVTLAPDGEVEDYAVTIAEAPTLPPANMSIEVCAAPGTGAFPAQPAVADGQVFWTGNTPAQTLNATLNGSDFASAEPFSVGPGASLNFLGTGVTIAGIDQTSAAEAFANGDYVDYSFTTAADLPAGRALSNVSRQSLFSTTFNFDMTVLVSDDPTFGSAHLVVEDARINQAPRTFHAFSTPLALEPSTQYYVRVLTYNNNTPSGLVGYDDLVLSTELCADYSDTPASFTNVTHAQQVEVQTHFLGAGISNDVGVLASPSADADDDDGITIPTLSQSSAATITAEVTGASGFLQGWIDFDGSGTFEAAEQIAANIQDDGTGSDATAADGTITFDVDVPANAVTAQTFARFRWSTVENLQATAAAPDGEVEDYAVTIAPPPPIVLPPLPSETCTINWHRWQTARQPGGNPAAVSPIIHGFGVIDTALGAGTWYEPTLPFNPGLGTTPADNVPNTQLGRSTFDETTENSARARAARSGEGFYGIARFELEPNVTTIIPLNDPAFVDGHAFMAFDSAGTPLARFPSVATLNAGQSYIASNSQTASEAAAVDFASTWTDNTFQVDVPADGIVFVHYVLIDEGAAHRHALRYCPQDVGDAPVSYGQVGHVYDPNLLLGSAKDVDVNLVGDATGAVDDNDGNGDNDEDGVTIPALTQGETATITAEVTGTGGYLQAWIDFDGSGTFEAAEQIATDLQDDGQGDDATAADGTLTFDVDVPANAVTTQTFARFRWSTMAGLDASAAAPDGEVEDYAVTIQPGTIPISGTVFRDNGTGAGATAHDGLIQGDEPGEGGVTVEAVDALTGDLVDTVQTNADGTYTLELPITQDGRETIIRIVPPTNTFLIANVSALPIAEVDPAGGVFTLPPPAGIARTGLDFGLAGDPRLTEDQSRTVAAGSAVTLPHTFTASSPVDVTFSLEDITQSVEGIFTGTLFEDIDCDQALGASDTVITGQRTLAAQEAVCLIVRVSAAAGAPSQTDIRYTLHAEGTYANSALVFTLDNADRVTITDDNGLVLTKSVCNATTDTCDLATGDGFSPANIGAPGDTLVYRIGFEAPGPEPVTDLVIFDQTPAFSALSAALPSIDPQTIALPCALTLPATPAAGYEGPLEWRCTGDLPPGSAGIASFEVRISD